MHYYRKAVAVFLLVITLLLPIFLEKTEVTAVVELERVAAESSYINKLRNEELNSEAGLTAAEKAQQQKEIEAQIMTLIKESAAELAETGAYQTIIFKHPLYRGGEDITELVIEKLDENNN